MVGVLGRERGDQGRGDVGVGGERAKIRDREVLGAAEEDCEVVGRGSHRVVVGEGEGIRDWRRGGIFLSNDASASGFRMQYEARARVGFLHPPSLAAAVKVTRNPDQCAHGGT